MPKRHQFMVNVHEVPLTIQEFADALNICVRLAREYARSESFRVYGISFDAAMNETKPTYKHGTGRRNKNWRIHMSKYWEAKDKRLI